jgi:hypothetical protein
MRLRAVPWLWPFLVAGCFDPQPAANLPCGPMMTCPTDQTCSAGICIAGEPGPDAGELEDDGPADASSVDAANVDSDGDGVLDPSDNCDQIANPTQHDEDTDDVGDACDNCPHVANPGQQDALEPAGQADGVGDACDPRPTLPGDSITVFYPFDVMPGGLMVLDGTTAIDSDQLAVTAGDGDTRLRLPGDRAKVTIEIAGTVDARDDDEVGLGVLFAEDNGDHHHCGYYDLTKEADYHTALVEYYDGIFNYLDAVHPSTELPLGPFLIRASADPSTDQINCTTTDSRGTFSTAPASPALQAGKVGVGGLLIPSYHLRYLVVFEH